MPRIAGSDNFFDDMRSGLDRLQKGMKDAKQNKISSFGDMRKGLDEMKRAKNASEVAPGRKTNASTKPTSKKK